MIARAPHTREEESVSTDNPYAAPRADLGEHYDPPGELELATRLTRLGAAMVDGLIGMAYGIPLAYATGIWRYAAIGQTPPLANTIMAAVLGFLGFLLIQGYLLKKSGQTIGKKLAGVRIADLDGGVPDFPRLILRRYLPISLAAQIPMVGPYTALLDALFIFRGDRRCIHDLIAGTRVLKVKASGNPKDRFDQSSESADWMFKERQRSDDVLSLRPEA